ncbi:MAG: hypothetical protein WC986_14775 [Elusimicrobiota bacterium]|jgi:hypothetical protein
MKTAFFLFSYGGVEGRVMDSVIDEIMLAGSKGAVLGYARIHDDALISRSRSKALSDFIKSDFDTIVMCDHDIEFEPGAVIGLAEQADLRKCLVSGMVSLRGLGAGIAGRMKNPRQPVHPGADECYEADYLGAGFLAIPRVVAEEVLKAGLLPDAPPNAKIAECIGLDGHPFYDFFRCVVAPNGEGKNEMLSEDWSFCYRARKANKDRPMYLWAKPMLLHWGEYGYSVLQAGQQVSPMSKLDAVREPAPAPGRIIR